jgi:hypothetical protein
MVALTCIKIKDENGEEMDIWMEAVDQIDTFPAVATENRRDGVTRGSHDTITRSDSPQQQAMQQFVSMQNTIRTFASYTLNSFRQISNANIDKVTLEFGINVGGEAGIPYITKGSVGSNIKITVQCSFPANGTSATHSS